MTYGTNHLLIGGGGGGGGYFQGEGQDFGWLVVLGLVAL